jgi:hypothetical protein
MSLENINIIIAVKSRVEHPPFFFKLHFCKKKRKTRNKKDGRMLRDPQDRTCAVLKKGAE